MGCPNGTAFTYFLALLNYTVSDGTKETHPGFAGHSDWRLPTLQELGTIVDSDACKSGACIDPVFGPTVADEYWSSDNWLGDDSEAYIRVFTTGAHLGIPKALARYARAVRGGK
jgi:hypothetical protein